LEFGYALETEISPRGDEFVGKLYRRKKTKIVLQGKTERKRKYQTEAEMDMKIVRGTFLHYKNFKGNRTQPTLTFYESSKH